MITVEQILKRLMKEQGITQKQLAMIIAEDEDNVERYEYYEKHLNNFINGQICSQIWIKRVAKALNISEEILFKMTKGRLKKE